MEKLVSFINTSIIIIIVSLFFSIPSIESFSNRFISEWIGLGYSHGGITDRAIRQVAFEYLNVSTEVEFLEKLTVDLWIRHVSVVDQIDQYNDNVDNDPGTKNRPMYHFDAERFVRANQWLLDAQQIILDALHNEQYDIARAYLGRYLHTHQDFYSHSNWIEMGENISYSLLGELNAFNDYNVASINMSTCLNCTKPCATCDYHCHNNIVPQINEQRIFTSGYYVGEVEDDHPVPKPTNVMKCSHGGIIDKTGDLPAVGGINKDVKTSILSPHDYDQEIAANVAIQSSYLFLKKLWHMTNTTHFGRMLELIPTKSSMMIVRNHSIPRSIIDRHCSIYVISNDSDINDEIYSLAKGKQCRLQVVSDAENIYLLDQLLPISLKPIVNIQSVRSDNQWYSFHVDRSMRTLKLLVQTKSDHHLNLTDLFILPDLSAIDDRWILDLPTIRLAEIQQPKVGQWFFYVNASMMNSFKILVETSIDFLHSFSRLNLNLTHPGLYSIDHEPIQGEHIYSSIRILSSNTEQLTFDRLEFIDRSNQLLAAYPLIQQTSTFYISPVRVPTVKFHVRVIGRHQQTGERIERQCSNEIIPRTANIDVQIETNALRSGESTRIYYNLNGQHSPDEPISISIALSNPIFQIQHDSHHPGSFLLQASNHSDHIGHSSDITIIAHHSLRSTFIDSYSFPAMIRSPLSINKSFVCTASFPSHYKPKELCQGPTKTCSSRQWDILLNLTEIDRIHSIVMTYYDSENLLQSKKQSVIYRFDHHDKSLTNQMLLTSNSCCQAYVDIVAYDQQGHRVICLSLEPILLS